MRIRRSYQGALLGIGAPIGWLAWRVLRHGVEPFTELATNADLYLYLTCSTVVVFVLFGQRVGAAEGRLKTENVELSALAVTDALTGLRNAGFFRARLEEAFENARRQSHPVSLVVLDIDHFKAVNDTYGHLVGDEVIREVAARVRMGVRGADTAARIGGEEFALLLAGTPLETATQAAERVRHSVCDTPIQTSAGEIALTLSAGVACDAHLGADELFTAADAALYEAKSSGRNRVVTSRPKQVEVDRDVG